MVNFKPLDENEYGDLQGDDRRLWARDPLMSNMEFKRASPEEYNRMMKARDAQQKRQYEVTVAAQGRIDEAFTDHELHHFLDEDVLRKLYRYYSFDNAPDEPGEILPSLMVLDLQSLLHEESQKAQEACEALDQAQHRNRQQELELGGRALQYQGPSEFLASSQDHRHFAQIKELYEESERMKREGNLLKEKWIYLKDLTKAIDVACLDPDDRPLDRFLENVHNKLEYLKEKAKERKEEEREKKARQSLDQISETDKPEGQN